MYDYIQGRKNNIILVNNISNWAVPLIIFIIVTYGLVKGVSVYDAFTEGAKDGLTTIAKVFPYLLAMMIAIELFKCSGCLNLFLNFLSPLFSMLKIEKELLPLLFLRPLSGSGALAYTGQLFENYGPDSMIGKIASTVQGSTETTFYIIAVYFGAVGIRKYRYSIVIGLMADLAGFAAAVFICNLLFS